MVAPRYVFRSVWTVDAAPDEAYAVLHDLESYPRWWREVKETRRVGESRFAVRCRSVLPYDLDFVTEQTTADPDAGVLEAKMTGDLEGFSRWTIEPHGTGSRLTFDEEVVTNKASLRRLAPVARPAFRANHTLMMRHGRSGLQTYLAGYRFGRATY